MLKHIHSRHKELWPQANFRNSAVLGLALLFLSLVVYYFAASYATKQAGQGINDVILNHLPYYDMSFLFVWGAAAVILLTLVLAIHQPKYFPFLLKSAATFVIIRSFFITLTHIGAPPNLLPSSSSVMRAMNFTGDLFFSGHAGMPFLMALIFWPNKKLRYIFLVSSVVLSFAVLLGHLHYSIDVFAAYFITYTIFEICKKFFKKDYEIFI